MSILHGNLLGHLLTSQCSYRASNGLFVSDNVCSTAIQTYKRSALCRHTLAIPIKCKRLGQSQRKGPRDSCAATLFRPSTESTCRRLPGLERTQTRRDIRSRLEAPPCRVSSKQCLIPHPTRNHKSRCQHRNSGPQDTFATAKSRRSTGNTE
jgi:hypothetical protein